MNRDGDYDLLWMGWVAGALMIATGCWMAVRPIALLGALNPGWDGWAAIGTLAAVVVALWTATRAERQLAESEQAVLHAAIVLIAGAATILADMRLRIARGGETAASVAAAYVQIGSLGVIERAAVAMDLTRLPTPAAVDHMVAGLHAIDVATREILAVSRGGDTELLFAQIADLREVARHLASELA